MANTSLYGKTGGLKIYKTYIIDTVLIKSTKTRATLQCIENGVGISAVVMVKIVWTDNKSLRMRNLKGLSCETDVSNSGQFSRTRGGKVSWLDKKLIHRSGKCEIPYQSNEIFEGDQMLKAQLFYQKKKYSEKKSADMIVCPDIDSITGNCGYIDTFLKVRQFILESADIDRIIFGHD